MAAQPQQPINYAAINMAARNAIQAQSVIMTQQIFAGAGLQTTPTSIIKPQNVGLILGFWCKVVLSVSNGSGVTIDLTDFGPANALSNIQFLDLNNVTRINTPGWHCHFVNTAKMKRPFGTALVRTTGFDSPINYGALAEPLEIGLISGGVSASSIAAGATGTLTMWYWIPLAYGGGDLRGCVYANVVNATMQLQLSLPGTYGVSLAVANGTDSTQAVFVGHAAGAVTSVSLTNAAMTVYQVYYDQLPRDPQSGALLLPITDLATAYELKTTSQSAITVNQDFPYQYSNFRDFLSTIPVFVNTAATGARTNGADVNYWQLLAANLTPIWKKEPGLLYLQMRNNIQVDMPPGVYLFESRERPIATTQYGNMQLVLNASTVGTGAYTLVGVEDFALLSTLSTAGSLAAS
jgi:hypothetical protein